MGGNGEGNLRLALFGNGDVGGDEIAPARGQSGNECVPPLHLYPVDIEKVLLGEAANENAVKWRRVEGDGVAGVTSLRLPIRNDDGERASRCNQLKRRVGRPRDDFLLRVHIRRTRNHQQPGADEHREQRRHGIDANSGRCSFHSSHRSPLKPFSTRSDARGPGLPGIPRSQNRPEAGPAHSSHYPRTRPIISKIEFLFFCHKTLQHRPYPIGD